MPDDNTGELTGATVGPYRILRRLGRGGMGEVYLAQDESLERLIALKILSFGHLEDDSVIQRFHREAKAAAQLDHPHIVPIYAMGTEAGLPYIAMRYVEGAPVDRMLKERGPFSWQRALTICGQVASALDCAHSHGVIHRDIKPANIVVDRSWRAHVTDFGVAKVLQAQTQLTTEGTFIGTPQYMSPEQCGVGEVGPASDLFSLGATIYEMISGRVPFRADTPAELVRKITMESPEPLVQHVPDVPPGVQVFVASLLEKDPGHRYSTAREVIDDLSHLHARRPLAHVPPLKEAPVAPISPAASTVERGAATPPSDGGAAAPEVPGAPPRRRRVPTWRNTAIVLLVLVALMVLGRAMRARRESDLGEVPDDAGVRPPGGVASLFRDEGPGVVTFELPLENHLVTPVGWLGDPPFLMVRAKGLRGGVADLLIGLAAVHPTRRELGDIVRVPMQGRAMADAPWRFGICTPRAPENTPLHNTLLYLRPIRTDGGPRRMLMMKRYGNDMHSGSPPETVFVAGYSRRPRQDPECFRGDCLGVAAKPDGHTLCLTLLDPRQGTTFLAERKVKSSQKGQVGPPVTEPSAGEIRSVQYSPDGDVIAYLRTAGQDELELWMARSGGEPDNNRTIAAEGVAEASFAFHPHRPLLAVSAAGGDYDDPRIHLCDFQGDPVGDLGSGWIGSSSWLPSGKHLIAVVTDEGGVDQVCAIDPDSAERRPLTQFTPSRGPERGRSPQMRHLTPDVLVSPDGTWAAAKLMAGSPGAIVFLDLRGVPEE